MWATLGEIGVWQSGGTPSRMCKEYYEGDIPWLKTGDLNDGMIVDIPEFITQKALEETSVKLNPIGSILVAMYGATIGKIGILTFPATTNQACCACSNYQIEQMYLFYFLLARRTMFIAMGGGGAQPNISKEKITATLIPTPPLREQKRIVAEIQRWFALIDTIEQGKEDLQTAIKQAKNKILDLAIHGKLVPQDPNDEPASELLKRINPKAQITCDNEHNGKLPQGWGKIMIGEVCENINGLWRGKKGPLINVGVIRNANFTKGFKLDYSKIKHIDVEERAFEKRHLLDGDLIVEKSGGSDAYPVGRAVIYEGKSSLYSFSNFTMILRPKDKKQIFIYHILNVYQKGMMRSMQTQTIGLHNLILDKYLSINLSVPPLSEQQRIVRKIEELFSTLDGIQNALEV
ncbi:restriction endonuclease [Tannerella serpentiformis]|nr:restriction endonuclease [Tannerella serpentiformis]